MTRSPDDPMGNALMLQQTLTILLIALAALWLARLVYRALFAKNSGCGGSCNCGHKDTPTVPNTPPTEKPQTLFFSADDLVRRYKARH